MGPKPYEGQQAHEAQSVLIKRKRSQIPYGKNDEKKQKIAVDRHVKTGGSGWVRVGSIGL